MAYETYEEKQRTIADPSDEGGASLRPLRDAVFRHRFLFLALTCYWAWQLSFFQSPLAVLPVDGMSPVPLSALLLLGASLLTYLFVYREDARMASWAARRRYLVLIGVCMAGGTAAQGLSPLASGTAGAILCDGGSAGYGRRRGPLRGGGRSRVRPTGPSSCPAAGRGEHFLRGSVASRGVARFLGAAALCFWLWPLWPRWSFFVGRGDRFPRSASTHGDWKRRCAFP